MMKMLLTAAALTAAGIAALHAAAPFPSETELRAKISARHPRLFLTLERMPEFKKYVNTPAMKVFLARTVRNADRAPETPRLAAGTHARIEGDRLVILKKRHNQDSLWFYLDRESCYGRIAAQCTIAYFATGEKKYFDKAVRYLDAYPGLLGFCRANRIMLEWYHTDRLAATVAYDWLYNELSPEKCPKIQKNSDLLGEDDVAYDFDPTATCPKWEKAVKAWFPEEEEQKMFQRSFGYFISRSTSLNCAFFWYGEAGTGKSTAAAIVRAVMGENRCCAVPWDRINGRFNMASLTTHYMNILEELPTGGATRGQCSLESLLKTATDGGVIQAERKGIDPTSARVKARFLSCTNELPKFSDGSNGIWDRLVIQEFTQRIRNTDTQKVNYADELCAELPGIFNWAVRGMKELADCKRFPLSPHSVELLADLRKRCDLEGSFVREKFVQGKEHKIPLRNVMAAYDEYVQTYNAVPKSQDAVKAALQKVFPYVKFARARFNTMGQLPAMVNLVWRDDDDEFPSYPGQPPQRIQESAEPEQKAAEAGEKSPSMDPGEPDLPAEKEQPELF